MNYFLTNGYQCVVMAPKKKGKKGPKLTKAEKARLKIEEEERRVREEEEARIQAEREEQERLERQRRQEILDRLEAKDSKRRGGELGELRSLLDQNYLAVMKYKNDVAQMSKWEKYMQCSDIPDPAVQQEINTFISLWRDDPERSVKTVLKQCNVALKLIEELATLLREVTDEEHIPKYQEALLHLQDIVYAKILNTNIDILKGASNSIDTETGNMQAVIKDDNTTLCLWANLMRNPRLRTFFEDIPLEVTEEGDEAEETQEETQEDKPAEEQEQEQTVEEEVPPAPESEGAKHSESQLSRASMQHAEDGDGQIVTQVEVLVAEATPPPPDDDLMVYGEGVEAVDLRKYTPLGGVFYYELFHLPPQSYQVKGWEIRKMSDAGLKVFQSIAEKSNQTEDEEAASPLVGLSVNVPDAVVFLETPLVGRWDAEGKFWRMDGISGFSYRKHHTYANFPFRSWELRPVGKDSALFSINGALIDLCITIQGNQCMLQSEREVGLTDLFNKWMSAPDLQQAMLKAGINIFVNEHTDKFVTSCRKDPLMEHVVYEQMALFASVCAFSWSKWNAQCGPEHIVIKVCEHQGPDPAPEDLWNLYLVGAQRFQKLEITETSEVFCADHHPDSEFHSTFIHMLQDNMSHEGICLTRETHFLFVDTVQSLFCAIRPLMFC
ncbi:dynein axonemal intermediate chain 7 isoform X4 [Phycodurus eques]|uniref:dynein axonemal intermediate chain 7 isoform X4 n=1 Tax=Phycodurus eques TaxID=693459 RepID=UPI002ACE89C9|nr:dynein axonemal intermediate chain 7 isoform X4 [Phycodurus eques]